MQQAHPGVGLPVRAGFAWQGVAGGAALQRHEAQATAGRQSVQDPHQQLDRIAPLFVDVDAGVAAAQAGQAYLMACETCG